MKINPTHRYQLKSALQDCAIVLRDMKSKTLKGKALADMKLLESVVQTLECLLIA